MRALDETLLGCPGSAPSLPSPALAAPGEAEPPPEHLVTAMLAIELAAIALILTLAVHVVG